MKTQEVPVTSSQTIPAATGDDQETPQDKKEEVKVGTEASKTDTTLQSLFKGTENT